MKAASSRRRCIQGWGGLIHSIERRVEEISYCICRVAVKGRQIAPEVVYLARDGYLVELSLVVRKA